jgi:hypothetical protein
MSKKDNRNYELKSEAVDKLLKAEKGEVPEFSQEELKRYRSKGGLKLPETLKVVLLKTWFAGAVCYFILWGLGTYIYSIIDMLFILGIVLGLVTDLLTNNVIRFVEKTPGENDKWLLFPKKGMVSFFLNMVYAIVLVALVYGLYGVINSVLAALLGLTDTVALGVEPILFGVFTMGFDMLFIGCRNLMKNIIADAKMSA